MDGRTEEVCLWLTFEEAEEILGRCLSSEELDTPAFQRALLKLARATFASPRQPEPLAINRAA